MNEIILMAVVPDRALQMFLFLLFHERIVDSDAHFLHISSCTLPSATDIQETL